MNNHMEVMLHDGTKGIITLAEAMKIVSKIKDAKMEHQHAYSDLSKEEHMKMYIHEMKEKASENLKHLAGWSNCPDSENDAKRVLYDTLSNTSWEQSEIIYEMMEFVVAKMYCDFEKKYNCQ